MRHLKLGSVEEKDGSQTHIASFLCKLLDTSPDPGVRAGMSPKSMLTRAKLIMQLEALGPDIDSIDIEDAEFELLKGIFDAANFTRISNAVLAIHDYLNGREFKPAPVINLDERRNMQ